MKAFYKKNIKAFSLVEVLIAMAVLSFGLLGIYSMFIHGAKDIDYGKRKSIVTTSAQQKMEDLISRRFEDPAFADGQDTVTVNNFTVQRYWTVVIDSTDTTISDITVNVDYSAHSGKKTYTLSSKKRRQLFN